MYCDINTWDAPRLDYFGKTKNPKYNSSNTSKSSSSDFYTQIRLTSLSVI